MIFIFTFICDFMIVIFEFSKVIWNNKCADGIVGKKEKKKTVKSNLFENSF